MELEFVPPGTHRALKAERAIETWKYHFISILAGTDQRPFIIKIKINELHKVK